MKLLTIVGLAVALVLGGAGGASSDELAKHHTDWSVIDFEGDYRLTKVTVEIRKNCGSDYRDGEVVSQVALQDKKALRNFERAFRLAKISPPTKFPSATGLTPTAMLECQTTKGQFAIYWNDCFVLNAETPASDNQFWSMGLALLIDQALRQADAEGMSDKLIDKLSGQQSLTAERRSFEVQEK
jgi:hypothetical protein